MVERHFTTYGAYDNYRSNGGTTITPSYPPQLSSRNYFDDYNPLQTYRQPRNDDTPYYDSADWYKPQRPNQNDAKYGKIGNIYTGEPQFGHNNQSNLHWYNYGPHTEKPNPSEPYPSEPYPPAELSPFECQPMQMNSGSDGETTFEELGGASSLVSNVIFKILNTAVIPGLFMHGILYFDVIKSVKIIKTTLNIQSTVKKNISGKNAGNSESQLQTFKIVAVTTTGGSGVRQKNLYEAQTTDWSPTNLSETLNFPEDFAPGDENSLPFMGPITLGAGTHAIPFSVRIPAEVNPSITYERKESTRNKALVKHVTKVTAELELQPANSGGRVTLNSGEINLDVQSCGGLPATRDGAYGPGAVQLVDLKYKEGANALVIMERKVFLPGDKIRIVVYSDNRKALKSFFVELVQSTNLPELDFSDTNDVIGTTKEKALELMHSSSKTSLSTKYTKHFVSKVGAMFPSGGSNESSSTSGRPPPYQDDLRRMSASDRVVGGEVLIPIPKKADPSFEAGESRIRYHIRIHFNVRHAKKPISQAQLIAVASQLRNNYEIKYIKFVS